MVIKKCFQLLQRVKGKLPPGLPFGGPHNLQQIYVHALKCISYVLCTVNGVSRTSNISTKKIVMPSIPHSNDTSTPDVSVIITVRVSCLIFFAQLLYCNADWSICWVFELLYLFDLGLFHHCHFLFFDFVQCLRIRIH